MIGSTPLSGFPISDFHGEVNFMRVVARGGGVAGSTAMPVGRTRVAESVGGGVLGGAVVWTFGVVTPGGYPMYGDVCYGDMPYLLRQTEGVGGAVGGMDPEYAPFNRTRVEVATGGGLAGGEAPYIRICVRWGEGGMLGGGWGDEDGDFSKIITCYFYLKWPEVLFVPPSERWDIPNVLRSLE